MGSVSISSPERRWWTGYMSMADRPGDDDQRLLEHRFLILAGTLMSGGGVLWGTISVFGGLFSQSLVPYGYVVVTVFNFLALAKWKNFAIARRVQIAASILLPFMFQWALGGFAASGGMMYWGMVGLVGSLSFDDTKTSMKLLLLFIILTVVSAALDAYSVLHVPAALGGRQLSALFIGLNFVVVSSMVFFLTLFFVQSRHEAIRSLKTKNTELAVSTRAAEEATRRADAANEARGRFLAVVSHEMRTPLNGVLGLTNLALETDLDHRQRELLSQSRVSAEILAAIINDVLDFSKIEAGGVTLETIPFRLDDVLHRLTSAANTLAMKRGVEFVLHVDGVPPVLVGDPTRLGQVLLNLVSNAVKFTEEGEVLVRLTSERISEGEIELRADVRDTGIGIAEDQLERLFQPFEQADDSTTRKYGGTGLGLPICKHFVEMMGGEIWIDSAVGEGSTFSFTARFGHDASAARAVPGELSHVRALVVDDNETARDVLLGYLDGFDIEAEACEDAKSALEAVEERSYGLVLADLRMPGLDGIELIRRLRTHPNTKDARLVLVTAFGGRRDEEEAAKAGADAFLAKPLRPSMLLDRLVQLFAGDLAAESHELQAPQQSTGEAIRGAKVLVVEDNDINREILVSSLQMAGLHADVAVDGQEGLDRATADSAQYDIVLMDLQMPNMDGLEATRRIREHGVEVPIIGVTANALSDARSMCIEAGMDEVVTKPVHMELLFNTMVRAIGTNFVPSQPLTVDHHAADDGEPVDVEGLDAADGLARSGGNEALYHDLLRRFVRGHADAARQIREYLGAGEMEEARRVAHTLKGVSGNIGATGVFAATLEVQNALKDGTESEVHRSVDALDEELRRLVSQLGSFVSDDATEKSAAAEVALDEDELKRLIALVRGADIESVELFESLRDGLVASWGPETVDQMQTALDGYDFDAAVEVIDARGEA